jgi:hypothetical protein
LRIPHAFSTLQRPLCSFTQECARRPTFGGVPNCSRNIIQCCVMRKVSTSLPTDIRTRFRARVDATLLVPRGGSTCSTMRSYVDGSIPGVWRAAIGSMIRNMAGVEKWGKFEGGFPRLRFDSMCLSNQLPRATRCYASSSWIGNARRQSRAQRRDHHVVKMLSFRETV